MTAIRSSNCRAQAEAPLREVEAVANGTADAVIGKPLNERRVNAALQNEIFNQAADGIVYKRGGDSGPQSEAAAQPTSNVVFAAALPDVEVARRVNAPVAGIEAEHDFAQAQTIPAATSFGNFDCIHRSVNSVQSHIIAFRCQCE
ncbi:MAG: hypothetical protein ABR907_03020 [Terracidiphilus sp.]